MDEFDEGTSSLSGQPSGPTVSAVRPSIGHTSTQQANTKTSLSTNTRQKLGQANKLSKNVSPIDRDSSSSVPLRDRRKTASNKLKNTDSKKCVKSHQPGSVDQFLSEPGATHNNDGSANNNRGTKRPSLENVPVKPDNTQEFKRPKSREFITEDEMIDDFDDFDMSRGEDNLLQSVVAAERSMGSKTQQGSRSHTSAGYSKWPQHPQPFLPVSKMEPKKVTIIKDEEGESQGITHKRKWDIGKLSVK